MAYGPVFLHLYGVDEDTVLTTWTVSKFYRHKAFADHRLKKG